MIREVLTYPNKILKQCSKEVESFDEKLHQLLDDMYDTMMAKNGVGIAAVQVGVLIRAIVINLPNEKGEQDKKDLIEIINPKIHSKSGVYRYKEGCLSVPEFYSELDRSKIIEVSFFDRFGSKVEMRAEDFLAVAFQHEIDHLDGHLFVERLSIIKRKKFEKEFKKIDKKQKIIY